VGGRTAQAARHATSAADLTDCGSGGPSPSQVSHCDGFLSDRTAEPRHPTSFTGITLTHADNGRLLWDVIWSGDVRELLDHIQGTPSKCLMSDDENLGV
jgi:hypothetical protein